MLKLVVIGTGWISRDLVEAAQASGLYQVVGVVSRSPERGKEFADSLSIPQVFENLDQVIASKVAEAIYIGTPNATHFAFAKQALEGGLDVLVEKPAFVNGEEFEAITQLAHKEGRRIMEAARHVWDPFFSQIKVALDQQQDQVRGAVFSLAKYSSKMDDYLQGQVASSLSSQMAGGALMDLGVYPLYNTLAWFGQPKGSHYYWQGLDSGVDEGGTLILTYPTFHVTIHLGKGRHAHLTNEIYFGKTSWVLDSITHPTYWRVYQKDQLIDQVTYERDYLLLDEVKAFALTSQDQLDQKWQLAKLVNQTLSQIRLQAGILFEGEHHDAVE